MFGQFNGSSYYRANPYYQQGNMPDTAFKNRKPPSYMVELPQGQEHFEPTNKKHFQRLGYYSTIANQHLIDPETQNSPSQNKHYIRNLNVQDIDGANTNTLISKAVKNRMKAQQYLAQRKRQQQDMELQLKMSEIKRAEDTRNRQQALSKINRGKQPNYHEQIMKMKTEQSEKQSPPRQQAPRIEPPPYRNMGLSGQHQMELQKTEREIQQLQEQLQRNRKVESQNIPQFFSRGPYMSERRPLQTQKGHPDELLFKEQPKQGLSFNFKKPQKYVYSDRPQFQSETRRNIPLIEEQNFSNHLKINQSPAIEAQNQHQGSYQGESKLRSMSDPRFGANQIPSTLTDPSTDVRREIETPIYDRKGQESQVRQTRQEHRRINPTYLSYGSQSIGLAGRKIVGF